VGEGDGFGAVVQPLRCSRAHNVEEDLEILLQRESSMKSVDTPMTAICVKHAEDSVY
jgi:hypothetical protein